MSFMRDRRIRLLFLMTLYKLYIGRVDENRLRRHRRVSKSGTGT